MSRGLLLSLLVGWTMGLFAPVSALASPWDGFQATTLDGRELSAEALAGQVVLLDFWATWCAPCLGELPHLKEAYARYGQEGLEIVGVSLDQKPRRELESFLRRREVVWPQVWDGRGFSGKLARRFGVETLPRSFLVDGRGRIVATDLRGEDLLAVLEALLGG